MGITKSNQDIRNAIEMRGLKHYVVADALGVSSFTFSRWLQLELPPEKKREIRRVIRSLGEKKNDGICPTCGRPYED